MDLTDHHAQLVVRDLARRRRTFTPRVEPRPGHLDELTQPLHRIAGRVIIDETEAAHRVVSLAK